MIFETKMSVRVSDLNYGNHVGHDKLISMIHHARLLFLNKNEFSEGNIGNNIHQNKVGLIVAELSISYKNPLFLFDEILFQVYSGNIKNRSFDLITEIYNISNKKLIATCIVTCVAYDYSRNIPASIPETFLNYLNISKEKDVK